MHFTHCFDTNRHIELRPYDETHVKGLLRAGSELEIWNHYVHQAKDLGTVEKYLSDVLIAQEKGEYLAHTIFADGEIIGQSCYLALRHSNAGLEIGGTWYSPRFQGTKVNPSAKYLLLKHAFDQGAIRVEFKTDSLNEKSRGALLKLCAKFEGIFRNHMIRADGSFRHSAYYSIIKEEWPEVSQSLLQRIEI